ncbi:MAG: hypothetical protein Q4C00_06340 [Bacillota bacterium]|nr:hypothetical protein [Bacillota bacterium]
MIKDRFLDHLGHSVLPIIIFIAVFWAVLACINNVGGAVLDEQLSAAEESLRRGAIQCYVLEGAYPEDLNYLAENYGVALNRDEFVYHYNYWGGNIMPDIYVFRR